MSIRVLCMCVCTVEDFSAEDKASGVKFCTAVHRRPRQGISHFCEHCSPRSPKLDESSSGPPPPRRSQRLPFGCRTHRAACERRIGMCGYTSVPEDGRTCVVFSLSVLKCWRATDSCVTAVLLANCSIPLFGLLFSSLCSGHDVEHLEFIPEINRVVFSEPKTQTLYVIDPASPKVPMKLSAVDNVLPSAFTVDQLTGYTRSHVSFSLNKLCQIILSAAVNSSLLVIQSSRISYVNTTRFSLVVASYG